MVHPFQHLNLISNFTSENCWRNSSKFINYWGITRYSKTNVTSENQ